MDTLFDLLLSPIEALGAFFGLKFRTEKYDKGQNLRLIDVFLLGPFMIWFGYKSQVTGRWIMMISGGLTIAYNGRNYLRNRLPQ
jgi:hypothetical protein